MNNLMRYLVLALMLVATPSWAQVDAGDMQLMPDMRWTDAQGNGHHLFEYKGRPVILHFWASWCIPCREEMPEVIKWRNEHPQYTLLAISLDDRMAQTKNFLAKHNFDLPALLVNQEDSVLIPVVPYTIYVNKEMKFVGYSGGVAAWSSPGYQKSIEKTLAK